jgi:hypothetical protein
MRWGCALVIDGDIRHEGYLEENRIKSIVENIDVSRYLYYTDLPYN